MELTMNMGAFEPLDQQELVAVDGGKSAGQVMALAGGTTETYTGLTLFCVGAATLNPVMAAAGFGLMCSGIVTMSMYYD